MSYFLFNGISSKDIGLMITKPLIRPSWVREMEEITLPGSERKIMQLSKSHKNANLTVSAVVADATPQAVRDIYAVLSGYGTLVLSSAPDEQMNAYVEPLVPEAVALEVAELPINFVCEPFAYAKKPTITVVGTSYTAVTNSGSVAAYPEVQLTAQTGEIVIDTNATFFKLEIPAELNGKAITLNCDAQVAYYTDNAGQKVSINQYTYGDFPVLHPGTNYCAINGTQNTCNFIVRARWY